MRLDFGSVTYSGKWYRYPDGEQVEATDDEGVFIKIRMHPMSRSKMTMTTRGPLLDGQDHRDIFCYSFEKQRGMVGGDDKPLPEKLGDDVKRKIYDFNMGDPVPLPNFVLPIAQRLEQQKQDAEKN